MSWSPNVVDLPVTGEKPISSQKWKNVVYDIYNKLNVTRLLNTGVVAPVDAETGMPWVDTSNGITLKLYNALDLQWHPLAFYSDLVASNVVVTPSGNLSASDVQAAVIELQADIDTRLLSADVVTKATANKVLRLNADSKLPASITGDADTVDGKHATDFTLSVDVVTEATANKVLRLNADSKLPASITGDADTVDGKHATAFQEVSQKDQPNGYVGLDNNGALNSKIRSTSISDFNTATIGGLYYWGTATINAPVPGSGGTALVIDRKTSNGGVYQQASDWYGTTLYVRVHVNGTWSGWKRIDKTVWGSITGTLSAQTDLQAALDGKQSVSEKDQPGGYAGLDTGGKIPSELLNITDPIWGGISGTLADQTDLQTALNGKASVTQVAPSPLAFSKSTEIGTDLHGTSVYYSKTFSTSKPCCVFANGSMQLNTSNKDNIAKASIIVDDIFIASASTNTTVYTTENFTPSSGIGIRPGSHTLKVLVSATSNDRAYGRNLSATLYFV